MDAVQQQVHDLLARIQQLEGELVNQQQAQQHLQQQLAAHQQPAGGAGGAPIVRRSLPSLLFRDEEKDDWKTFRRCFEQQIELQHYNDHEAQTCLAYSIRGNAAKIVDDIHPNQPHGQTIADMLDRCEARFITPAASALARSQFETATQQASESLRLFHGRVRDLWRRAYPAAAQQADETILIRRFALGLRVVKVRDQVLRTNPLTYEAALDAAQTEQSVYVATHPEKAEHLAGRRATPADEPMDISLIGAIGNLRCYHCKGHGHFLRECPKLTGEKKDGRPGPLVPRTREIQRFHKPDTKADNAKGQALWRDKFRRLVKVLTEVPGEHPFDDGDEPAFVESSDTDSEEEDVPPLEGEDDAAAQ